MTKRNIKHSRKNKKGRNYVKKGLAFMDMRAVTVSFMSNSYIITHILFYIDLCVKVKKRYGIWKESGPD